MNTGDSNMEGLTKADLDRLKQVLAEAEKAGKLHVFSEKEVMTLRNVIDIFDEHGSAIKEILRREQVYKLWIEVRARGWSVARWFLTTFLLIIGAVQGYQAVIVPWLKTLGK
jgi:hypothetical protein